MHQPQYFHWFLPGDQGLPFSMKLINSSGYSWYCNLVSLWCQKANFPIEVHSKFTPGQIQLIFISKISSH
uniref:Uncharacterized protein n=1 Tax=Anguilla anguilla TaxID=7936 RepID=A0A0E9RE18_ANGAN